MVYTYPYTYPDRFARILKPAENMVPRERIELSASPLPRGTQNPNYLINNDIFLGKVGNAARTQRFYTPLQSHGGDDVAE